MRFSWTLNVSLLAVSGCDRSQRELKLWHRLLRTLLPLNPPVVSGTVQERDHGAGTGQRKERECGNALGLPAAGLGNVHSDDVNGRCCVPGSSVCQNGFLLSRMSCCHIWAICQLFQFWSKSNPHSDYSYPKHLWYSASLRFGSLKKTCELVYSGFGTALILTASENAL